MRSWTLHLHHPLLDPLLSSTLNSYSIHVYTSENSGPRVEPSFPLVATAALHRLGKAFKGSFRGEPHFGYVAPPSCLPAASSELPHRARRAAILGKGARLAPRPRIIDVAVGACAVGGMTRVEGMQPHGARAQARARAR